MMFINFYKDDDGGLFSLEQHDHTIDGALKALEDNPAFWDRYAYTVEIFGASARHHNLAETLGGVIRNRKSEDPYCDDEWDDILWRVDSATMNAAEMVRNLVAA